MSHAGGYGASIIELDGRRVTEELLARVALVNDGHFTVAQVRSGRVRGFAHHLHRLDAASRVLYGIALDPKRVRSLVAHALGGNRVNATLRVTVVPGNDEGLCVLVSLRPPAEAPRSLQALMPTAYERPFAHIKHIGTFAQIQLAREAVRAGYDDALLTTKASVVLETTSANIGFVAGDAIVWPEGASLRGITEQLLADALPAAGLGSVSRPVLLEELGMFDAAFVTGSTGISPVGRIGDVALPVDPHLYDAIASAYASIPADDITVAT